MKISELKDCPRWLSDASTENADVEVVEGSLVWKGGRWRGGRWEGGVWKGGRWEGGVWEGGVWESGCWESGVWKGGRWEGIEDRLKYMLSICGIHKIAGCYVGYRTTRASGHGRYTTGFVQKEGEYYEKDIPKAGSGTCVPGIHITSAAKAWTYFGVNTDCQFWEVRVKENDILDCDGEKARIRGGVFTKIERPF